MKYLIVFLIAISCKAFAFDVYSYASLGIGYKLEETEYDTSTKDSAIFEAGFETNYPVSFGIKHDSQLSAGKPFNDNFEYHKTEIFIRYKIGGK